MSTLSCFFSPALERPREQVDSPAVCAWCSAEAGLRPDPGGNQTHTICARHLAAVRADLESRRRAENSQQVESWEI